MLIDRWLRRKNEETRQEKEEMERKFQLQAMVQKRQKEIDKIKLARLHDRPFIL
jgi:hypothetical protein